MTKRKLLALLFLALAMAAAADVPRKAPELKIQTTDGKQLLLSQYKGKAVAVCFILTTCSHCQRTIGYLAKLYPEYAPKGFRVLASAIDQGARGAIPFFVKAFNPPFPVGFNDLAAAADFMQFPPMLNPSMPLVAFVDPDGMIREQHLGNDAAFFGADQEKNLRAAIESLLKPAATRSKK
jgi:peroxiredoxin